MKKTDKKMLVASFNSSKGKDKVTSNDRVWASNLGDFAIQNAGETGRQSTNKKVTRFSNRYPKAILHVDADAFFASVAQALEPCLQGRPVVTGRERGIIVAASYEAKELGIKRGVSLQEARRICPELVILETDYDSCQLFSQKMLSIMRRFTPLVEVNSIDEAFLDITGVRSQSYEELAVCLKETIKSQLGITVSVGLSVTKTLAKLCSSYKKPDGFWSLSLSDLAAFLTEIPVGQVWGVGRASRRFLERRGVASAADFVGVSEWQVRQWLGKNGVDIWHELQGEVASAVVVGSGQGGSKSIQKFETFRPASNEREVVWAHLLKNLELACVRARRLGVEVGEIFISLRSQRFESFSIGARLTGRSNKVQVILPTLRQLFGMLYEQGVCYRATGVVLTRFSQVSYHQNNLWEDRIRMENITKVSDVVDSLNQQFGRRTLRLASTLVGDKKESYNGRMMVSSFMASKRFEYPFWRQAV